MRQVHTTAVGIILSVAIASPSMAQQVTPSHDGTGMTQGQDTTVARDTTSTQAIDIKAPGTSAVALIDAAVKAAKASKKAIFVDFGYSGCSYCRVLHHLLRSAGVGKLFRENYVSLSLTTHELPGKEALNNPRADSVLEAWGGEEVFPSYAILDDTGKELVSSKGVPSSPEEVKLFVGLLEKTAPRATAAELTSVTNYLTDVVTGKIKVDWGK